MNKIKRRTWLGIAFLITVVFCIPFYRSTVFSGLDLSFHISRIDGLLSSIRDMQFPWAIYPEKNYGFGYASPLFYCDLFLVPVSLLYAIHIPIVLVYKIYVFAIALIGVYISLRAMHYFTNDLRYSIFGAIIFAFSAYHINDFFIRAALGEAMAFSLMPWFAVVAHRFFIRKEPDMYELAFFFTSLALCHLITFALSSFLFAILMILYRKTAFQKKHLLTFLKAVGIGFALSAFFLMPMLQQMRSQKFLYAQNRELFGESIMRNYSNTALSVFGDYLYLGGYDLESHHYYTGLVIFIAPVLFLFVKKNDETRRFMAWLALISSILFVCTTDLIPLYRISVLQSIQFTYRFNILIASLLPFVLVYSLQNFPGNQRGQWIAAILTVYTVFNTAVIYRQLFQEADQTDNLATTADILTGTFYENYNNHFNIAELGSGEYLPATHQMDYEKKQGIVTLFETEAASLEYARHGTRSTLRLNCINDGFIALPVSWYKGYQAVRIEDSGNVILPITQEEYTGQIVIPVSAGEHTYEVRYVGTKVQKLALFLSLFSLLALLVYRYLVPRFRRLH